MGIRSFFGFSSPGSDTMGRAQSPAKEQARIDRFEATGHASYGVAYSDPEIIVNPPRRRRNSHRD
jgi:hypothetical protein